MGSVQHFLGSLESNSSYNRKKSLTEVPEQFGLRFSLDEIKTATRNFHSDFVMGETIIVKIYKGYINGGFPIAIRRILRSEASNKPGLKEFEKEVLLLSQLRHPHLITLMGFCNEKDEEIIVYEYMENRSLFEHLYLYEYYGYLTWKQRLRICIGTACGIHYLHTGAKRGIIHGNLKPHTILLDKNLFPKISSFGLSEIGAPSMSKNVFLKEESEPFYGRRGYMAPEFFLNNIITEKLDVYSFGLVLVEILIAKRPFDTIEIVTENNKRHKSSALVWFLSNIKEGTIQKIIDPGLEGEIAPQCLQLFVEVAQSCLHKEGIQRPTMGEVELQLELALQLQERADPIERGC